MELKQFGESTPYDSFQLYKNIYKKEICSHGINKKFTIGECSSEIIDEVMIKIFELLSNEDIRAFSLANKACLMLTHNCNKNFWKKYSPNIVTLHPYTIRPYLTHLISPGKTECLNKKREKFTIGECSSEIIDEVMIKIFELLSTEDIKAFSLANKACSQLTHNSNENFWNKFFPGIVKVARLNKPILTYMINTRQKTNEINQGEEEMCQYLNKFISEMQPFQSYSFRCHFLSQADEEGNRTLMKPTVKFKYNYKYNKYSMCNSKYYFFRNAFTPSCLTSDISETEKILSDTSKTKEKISYFKMNNLPQLQRRPIKQEYMDHFTNFMWDKFLHDDFMLQVYSTLESLPLHSDIHNLISFERLNTMNQFSDLNQKERNFLLTIVTICSLHKLLYKKLKDPMPQLDHFETKEKYLENILNSDIKAQEAGLPSYDFESFFDVISGEFIDTIPWEEQHNYKFLKRFQDESELANLLIESSLLKESFLLSDIRNNLSSRIEKIYSPNYEYDGKSGNLITVKMLEEKKEERKAEKRNNCFRNVQYVFEVSLQVGSVALLFFSLFSLASKD